MFGESAKPVPSVRMLRRGARQRRLGPSPVFDKVKQEMHLATNSMHLLLIAMPLLLVLNVAQNFCDLPFIHNADLHLFGVQLGPTHV